LTMFSYMLTLRFVYVDHVFSCFVLLGGFSLTRLRADEINLA
jgi:hypothetical protein